MTFNPHCDNETLNRVCSNYIPLAIRIADWIIYSNSRRSNSGSTVINGRWRHFSDAALIHDAAKTGLFKAAKNWNPNQASCNHRCIIAPSEEECEHKGRRVTLGAYARGYIVGEIINTVKKESKHRGFSKSMIRDESDQHYAGFMTSVGFKGDAWGFYSDSPAEDMLSDGSFGDGRGSSERWAPSDQQRLTAILRQAILCEAKIKVRGLDPDHIWHMVECMALGMSHHEIAQAVSDLFSVVCRDKMVAQAITGMREILKGSDFYESKPVSNGYVGLPSVAQSIIQKYHPNGVSDTERSTIEKRIGAWATTGKIPAARGSDKRWRFSRYGAQAAIQKYRVIAAKAIAAKAKAKAKAK